ncbi:hypothetical protein JKP88DRAFT_317656 [Tribonema minus]|uniref:Nicastrin n=1 Tax=Tribonema minus TaxID=303371 RepID=A0A835YYT6_9STRA|nr:hypothetical protein JKP88DRAFT_317656 [Tribonema minus]
MFHSGGDIGCRLPERGKQAFPLLSVASQLELESFAADAAGFGKEKVAAAVPATMFTAAVVSQLEGTGVLGGLLVVDTPPPDTAKASAAAFSPEDRREGWNAHGSALLRRSLDFPVVLLSGEGGQGALEAGVSNRAHGLGSFPRYMAEFEFYFGAASISSKECLQWVDKDGARDPQCLPMGGQSSWGVLDGPYSSSDSAPSGGKPVVLLSAAMDSVSFFHNTVPAANGAASGLVALLAAADALAAAADDLHLTSLANAIGFAAFQGEAWGRAVVALDQVGILSSPHSLFLHASPAAATSSIDALLAVGADIGGDFSMGPSSTQELPPTSLDSFLENNSSVAGFVISGYDHPFADELYRSHWDTADRLDGATIQHAALAAARGVYVLAGGLLSTAMARIAANATLIHSLTDCIANDMHMHT